MSTLDSGAAHPEPSASDDASALSRLGKWLPTLLSIIAGMVDLTGFLSLGNLFTAHISGNLVVIGALVVRRGRINPAQILAIPVKYMLSYSRALPKYLPDLYLLAPAGDGVAGASLGRLASMVHAVPARTEL